MSGRCGAHDGDFPSAHTCDEPAACAVASLVTGSDERALELEALHDVLDAIEDLTHGRKTLRSDDVLKLIHDARGGPR